MLFFYIFFCLYYYFAVITAATEDKPIICDAKRYINLNYGDIVFLESPDFPAAMKESHKRDCKIYVSINDTTSWEVDLVFIVTNGYLDEIEMKSNDKIIYSGFVDTRIHVHFLYTNSTNITISFKNYTSESWNAFQGYVTYDYQNQTCPFSHLIPFNFTNASQIMYIRTKYRHFCHSVITQNCTWIFHGLDGYGFKFFLIEFDDINTELLVSNSSDYVITDGHYTKPNQVFYNSDKNLWIRYDGICNDSIDGNLFEAQISMVKNDFQETFIDCSLNKFETIPINTKKVWTNIKENEVGYPENARCEVNFNLFPKTQLVATITKLRIETHVDHLQFKELYYPYRTESVILDGYTHVFELPENVSNGLVNWKFKSDGSVQSKGFEVVFETIECKCSNESITVDCNETLEYHIMNTESRRVCGNLKCNFTIFQNNDCPEKHITIGFYRSFESVYNLEFQLYSNNEIYLNSKNFKLNSKITVLLPKNQKNILSFFSGSVTEESSFYFKLAAVDAPLHQNILLNITHPTFAIEFANIPENTILTVEMDHTLVNQNDALEMYANCEVSELLTNCYMYKDKTLSYILSNVEDVYYGELTKYERNYTSPINSITIYKPIKSPTDYSVVFFRAVNAHTENCLFKKTVFNVGTTREDKTVIAMAAGNKGPCEIILLSQPLSQKGLNKIWTNVAEINNIIFYDGLQERTKAFTFSKNNIHLWNKIILGSLFYTIILPPKTAIILETWYIYNSAPWTINNQPFNSFIDTPYFGIPSTHRHNIKQIGYYVIKNTTVKFELLFTDISENGSLDLIDGNNQSFSLTKLKPRINFSNTNVTVFFYEHSINFKGARVFISNNCKKSFIDLLILLNCIYWQKI